MPVVTLFEPLRPTRTRHANDRDHFRRMAA
jgi:hypothetical protein